MEQPPFGLAFLKQNEKDCNDEKTALNSVDYENLTNDQKTALQNMLKEYLNMQTAYHMLSQDSFKDVFAKGNNVCIMQLPIKLVSLSLINSIMS